MTESSPRRLPDGATVVDVDGSRFLLEWLDRDVLAAAAAARLREPVPPPHPRTQLYVSASADR